MLKTRSWWLNTVGALLFQTLALASFQGCGSLGDRPELFPYRSAPQHSDREWVAPKLEEQFRIQDVTATNSTAIAPEHEYDLPTLIDFSLMNNPQTQLGWSTARAAAAGYGSAQAAYYPQAAFASENGYLRTIVQLPGTYGGLKQWQADPVVQLNWILLDFGRRRSASDSARDRMIGANLTFNRSLQEVAFSTESSFYALDAADGAVIAAEQNLKLAETDLDAVRQRVDLGLATEPQLLLAREQVAQSQFDLANAHLAVHDAQAQLAVALGVPADPPVRIAGLETQSLPPGLNQSVEELIALARQRRPDLAAQLAGLRASEAVVRGAYAQFYPVVELSTSYGENWWNFAFKTPPTVQIGQPEYSAMVTLRWDIFTGFGRLNAVRAAQSNRDAARAQLRSSEIETIAQVWRAYYEVESSRSKYAYAQSLVGASQEAYDANLETYRQGLSTIVELLTAERDLANARYTLIQSKAQLLTAYAAIVYAAGAVYPR